MSNVALQQPAVHTVGPSSSTFHELDSFFSQFKPHAHLMDCDRAYASAVHAKQLHQMAFIDSQASNFVVPSTDYLTNITSHSPSLMVDTANGSVKPEAIGDTTLQMYSDDGEWHSFQIRGVWVLPGCDRILYSQAAMSRLGITHRLDEGYIILPNGARKTVTFAHLYHRSFISCARRSHC